VFKKTRRLFPRDMGPWFSIAENLVSRCNCEA